MSESVAVPGPGVLHHDALAKWLQEISRSESLEHEVRRAGAILANVLSAPAVARGSAEAHPLTPRERQVLQLVGEGKSTRDIAMQLGISVNTAESHRARLMRKLDIHQTAGLVRYAIRRGLVRP